MLNIEKYLNNTTQTSEGEIYKDEEAFNNKTGICHIGEYGLESLKELLQAGEDLTDDELVEKGIADTYDTIIEEVKRNMDYFDDELKEECTVEEIAYQAFDDALWTCVATQINQMTY